MSRTKKTPVPIAPARRAALDALVRCASKGVFLDEAMEEAASFHRLDSRDRRLAMEIAYGSTRFRAKLDYILNAYLAKGVQSLPETVRQILRTAVYQILHLTKIPAHACIHDAVELARVTGNSHLSKLVNAVLRGIVREERKVVFPDWQSDPAGHLEIVHSHPRHLVESWLELWSPEEVHEFCRFNNMPAPLYARLNPLKEIPSDLQDEIEPTDLGIPNCVRLNLKASPTQSRLVSEGYVTIQDPAAMLVPPLLSLKPGMRVWDVCAAPGGKATHCAEILGDTGQVVASDISLARFRSFRDLFNSIDIVCADGLHPPWERDSRPFDAILLDSPCTGWGTLRRHPDLRWRLSPSDPQRLGDLSYSLLESVCRFLRPGGVLVYATCTLSCRENQDVIRRFLQSRPNWRLETVTSLLPQPFRSMPAPEGWISIFPPQAQIDGMFAARLRNESSA
ncbi:MAG TPA: 16S rRNA (cytosine(967)-C(5))-methyltransferase RsmB [bacterium]|nr:16S rRNA (cytosine(967)-C(5))-methyltransferase RsmB [bacterium]HQL61877.1 16S rRNA (cytosine(967)-C(5))-methyltransferase RsmB [bacterium]